MRYQLSIAFVFALLLAVHARPKEPVAEASSGPLAIIQNAQKVLAVSGQHNLPISALDLTGLQSAVSLVQPGKLIQAPVALLTGNHGAGLL